jgi:hypothetical protein
MGGVVARLDDAPLGLEFDDEVLTTYIKKSFV